MTTRSRPSTAAPPASPAVAAPPAARPPGLLVTLDAAASGGRRSRRVEAARVARLLQPAGRTARWFASSELVVHLPGGGASRPDVAVVRGHPPADGRLHRAPDLVVVLAAPAGAEAEARRWLAAGTRAVWCVGDGRAGMYTRTRGTVLLRSGRWLTVPGLPALRTGAATLLP